MPATRLSPISTFSRFPYPEPPYVSPPFPRRVPGGPIEQVGQINRKYFNLSAARHPIAILPGLSFENHEEMRFAFPEKYLAARVVVDGVEIDVHNAHLPPGVSRGLIKVHAFEAIRRRIDADTHTARLLCGDFNAPVEEDAAGPISQSSGPWSESDQERWKLAEKRIVDSLHMRDVYRDVHERGVPLPFSHFTGRSDRRTGHRYDHIFASSEIRTESCAYLSEWLEANDVGGGLSDHAPVEAELSPTKAPS
jgi:endonuclease/exonuclease/phosphatase family metal-dependent hydrolase